MWLFLKLIPLKIWALVLAGLAGLAWFLKMRNDWIKKGEAKVRDKINKETEEVHAKWEEIDRTDPSFDDALRGLQRNGR